jgi:hypothetical protein
MTTTDYLLALSAMALVLWNMRRHPLTDRRLRRPVIIAVAVCVSFLHGVPTAGADGVLVALGVVTGAVFGLVGALATRVERDAGTGGVVAVATPFAVAVTALAFGGRLAFAIAATNGLGPAIARFSQSAGIHSEKAWVAGLVLMAAADLVVRALVLWQRRAACAGAARPVGAAG